VFEIFDDEQQAVNSFFPNRHITHFDILRFIEQQRSDADDEADPLR
jgi:anti-sigma B factor antagonist